MGGLHLGGETPTHSHLYPKVDWCCAPGTSRALQRRSRGRKQQAGGSWCKSPSPQWDEVMRLSASSAPQKQAAVQGNK